MGVLCADNHVGYSQPVGGAVAYQNHVSPAGVGFDIGCGNKAAKTNLLAADVDIPSIMDLISQKISFGIGRANNEEVDDPVLDEIAHADLWGKDLCSIWHESSWARLGQVITTLTFLSMKMDSYGSVSILAREDLDIRRHLGFYRSQKVAVFKIGQRKKGWIVLPP